ncbi:hypothetical protein MACH09_37370 [Vibrio sp. MACH09]|uniref:two-partner secretion domain-containing protein n=1 Tax=Vibrio sp. MACH09 TaxID=3025122 RepID=UPI00278E1BDB|nr:hemagglutinin repeat-containing protein [Vibrio sp. MACH09]GLO63229.1 hypothetical protein MACH09_37370 [Vibrio sp. MACH09]
MKKLSSTRKHHVPSVINTSCLQRSFAYLVCFVINVQPALASVVASGGNTTVTQARNGVEVVNIATPNSKGLSHNQYQQFNVDKSGLILNNSTEALARSQLGGIVEGNANLRGQAANVILNEVTGATASQLQGYTEVFGQNANVILSNAYGITCDGCGFINTPRVTLSTGAPVIHAGEVTGFDVSQGAVTIEGLGLDASQQNYFDIVSRTAKINAAIHAQDLSVVTGKNRVDYLTNQATKHAAVAGEKPTLAIDSSSLGGMYAGRITLIATEDGVGVNVGNLAASQGDIRLTSDGHIVLADVSSHNDLIVNSRDDVKLTGNQQTDRDYVVSAASITAVDANVASEGDLQLNSKVLDVQNATLSAKEEITTAVNQLQLDKESKLIGRTAQLKALKEIDNHGTVSISEQLTLQGEQIKLTGKGKIQAKQHNMQANSASIDTNVEGGGLNWQLDNTLAVTDKGNVTTQSDIQIKANKVTQQGKLHSGNSIDLVAENIVNNGVVRATQELDIQSGEVTNEGTLIAQSDMTVTADNLTNKALIYAGQDAQLQISNTLRNDGGDIITGRNLTVGKNTNGEKSQTIDNISGYIKSQGNMLLNAEHIINSVKQVTTASKTDIINGNSIGKNIRVKLGNCKIHSWKIRCKGNYSAQNEYKTVKQIHNSVIVEGKPAILESAGNLVLNADTVTNTVSQITSHGNIVINANQVSNNAYVDDTITTTGRYFAPGGSIKGSRSGHRSVYINLNLIDSADSREINDTYHSSITASGDINIEADKELGNGEVRQHDAITPSNIPTRVTEMVESNSFAVPMPTFPKPTSPNGLFVYSDGPKSHYLIETNPALVNLGDYLGSDYFQSKLGFNPNTDIKFLGDAYYDTRIINQAIFEQTGRRYLNSSVGNDFTQMQQLIDAAAKQKTELHLSAGISLTAEQVSKLTQDIIWYEETTVNGQTVLAPNLYLASVNEENVGTGAQIVAIGNQTLRAGEVTNQGRIQSGKALNIESDTTLNNLGGDITAEDNLTLHAQGDLLNESGTLSGDDVTLTSTNGSVINRRQSKETIINHGNNATARYSELGDAGEIVARGNLTMGAGNNIENQGSTINVGGDATLNAGKDIVFNTAEKSQDYRVNNGGGQTELLERQHYGSTLRAKGGVQAEAGEEMRLTNTEIKSDGDIALQAEKSITIDTALNEQKYLNNYSGNQQTRHSKTHQGSELSGSNVMLNSGKDVTLSGSDIHAEQNVDIKTKGDINIVAVNDSLYQYSKRTKEGMLGSKETKIHKSNKEKVIGSQISAGGDITIKAQRHSVLTAGGESDINLVGSGIKGEGEVTLSADGDINLAAAKYREFELNETRKSSFGGLKQHNKGSVHDDTLLESASSISGGSTSFTSGNNIKTLASELVSGGDVNLTAVDEVLISADNVLKQSQQWDEKTSFLSGGQLFETDKKRQGEVSSTAQSSAITSGANINISAGSIKVVGSELDAQNDANLHADTGDVEFLAATESRQSFSKEEKVSISFDGLTNMLTNNPSDTVKIENGKIKIAMEKAQYDKVKNERREVNKKVSSVTSGGSININSAADITVEGSQLVADKDKDANGDVTLTAKNNIIIKETQESSDSKKEEVHAKAEANIVVQHQAVETAKALKALQESTENLKQAKKDYQQYKKQLSALQSTLSELEQQYVERKSGVLFEDIEELRDLVSEVKSDEDWYIAGIVLATEDVTSKTTLATQQVAAAATSTSSFMMGFNAGIELDLSANKAKQHNLSTTSIASNIAGQNITLNAGNSEGDNLTVQGSHVKAQDKVSMDANEVNLLASTDTRQSKQSNDAVNGTVAVTVFGSATGANVNLGFSKSRGGDSATTHNNSQISGREIELTSTQDTNIKGANVEADEMLTVNVGNNLNVASVSNRSKSDSKSMGANVGFSLSNREDSSSGKDSSNNNSAPQPETLTDNTFKGVDILAGVNAGMHTSSNRSSQKSTVLTTLTSGDIATINVGKNTDVKGAFIATVDEHGKDLGNLDLTTDTLTYADLSNTNYDQSRSFAVSSGVNINSGEGIKPAPEKETSLIDASVSTSRLQYKNTSGYSKSKTLATVGMGNLAINDTENSDDTTALNRNVENSNKDLFTVDRKQGDFDVTVDHRLLSEEGRTQIGEDFLKADMFRETVERIITTDKVGIEDFFSETGKQVAVYDGIKEKIANDPELATKLSDPNATAAEKESILDKLTHSTLVNLGYEVGEYKNKIIAKDDSNFKGFYSEETGNSYVNDSHANNTEELVEAGGHELSHRMDDLEGDNTKYSKEDRETYADHFESDYGDYTEMALAINGHDGMASSNNHVGSNTKDVIENGREFGGLDKTKGNASPLIVVPIVVSSVLAVGSALSDPKTRDEAAAAINKGFNDAKDSVKELGNSIGLTWDNLIGADGNADIVDHFTNELSTLQAQVEIAHAEGNVDRVNELYGKIGEVSYILEQQPSKVISGVQEKLAQGGLTANTGGQQIPDPLPMPSGSEIKDPEVVALPNPEVDKIDPTTTTPIPEEQGSTILETPADSGVDPLLVVNSNNNNSDNHFDPSRRAEPGEVFYKTTKEATEAARALGFEKTNRRAKNGEAIYYNRKTKEYISRDVGSGKGGAHNGGVWKKAKSINTINSKQTRLGTFDADLNEIGK